MDVFITQNSNTSKANVKRVLREVKRELGGGRSSIEQIGVATDAGLDKGTVKVMEFWNTEGGEPGVVLSTYKITKE